MKKVLSKVKEVLSPMQVLIQLVSRIMLSAVNMQRLPVLSS